MIGMVYGWRLGMATIGLYLFEGLIGLPVFANGGGPTYFMGPTAGYLAGFIIAAGLVGVLAERGWDRRFAHTLLANVFGTAVIFFFGYCGLTIFNMSFSDVSIGEAMVTSWSQGVMPFLIGAGAKIFLAALTLPLIWRLVKR